MLFADGSATINSSRPMDCKNTLTKQTDCFKGVSNCANSYNKLVLKFYSRLIGLKYLQFIVFTRVMYIL